MHVCAVALAHACEDQRSALGVSTALFLGLESLTEPGDHLFFFFFFFFLDWPVKPQDILVFTLSFIPGVGISHGCWALRCLRCNSPRSSCLCGKHLPH